MIIWPSKEQIQKTLPINFRLKCPDCRVIIDCFEIFSEIPSKKLARAQLFSTYKHHHTIKFLISITPQASICFISEAWAGRVSDKHITENCGFLNKLEPGDVVLADRGFDIRDHPCLNYAKIEMPAFTRGKKQLPGSEVDRSRKISNLIIHVERVIGALKQKYNILSTIIPISLLTSDNDSIPAIDKIVIVCSGLFNMCPPIVSKNN